MRDPAGRFWGRARQDRAELSLSCLPASGCPGVGANKAGGDKGKARGEERRREGRGEPEPGKEGGGAAPAAAAVPASRCRGPGGAQTLSARPAPPLPAGELSLIHI